MYRSVFFFPALPWYPFIYLRKGRGLDCTVRDRNHHPRLGVRASSGASSNCAFTSTVFTMNLNLIWTHDFSVMATSDQHLLEASQNVPGRNSEQSGSSRRSTTDAGICTSFAGNLLLRLTAVMERLSFPPRISGPLHGISPSSTLGEKTTTTQQSAVAVAIAVATHTHTNTAGGQR